VIQQLKAGDAITGMTVPWDLVAGMPKGAAPTKAKRGRRK
jgi:hypothetical protein